MTDENHNPAPEVTTAPVAPTPSVISRIGKRSGRMVDNWISVPTWYSMIRAIGLQPGRPLQRLVERHWHASR